MTTREWTDEFMAGLRAVGDPVADDAVAAYFADVGLDDPGRLMARLVANTRIAPEERDRSIASFLDRPDPAPTWQDDAQIVVGQELFARFGLHIFGALYAAALPTAYAGWRGVHVLHLTARLATDTKRRLLETAQFHLDVMSRGGLDPGGRGIATLQHVRLMHAAVRWLVNHDPRIVVGPAADNVMHYDPAWGVPVCQADLVNTLLTFTQIPFMAFEQTGVVTTEAERQGYLHVFNLVGHHLGVRPDLLPVDLDDIRLLTEAMPRQQFGASAAGAEMTAALLEQSQGALRGPLRGLPASMMRFYLGDSVADMVSVPRSDWTRHIFGPMRVVAQRIGLRTAHSKLVARLAEQIGRAMLTHAVTLSRGGSRPDFEIPTHLAEQWGVPSVKPSGSNGASPGHSG